MCGIAGASFRHGPRTPMTADRIENVVRATSSRGRDSYGVGAVLRGEHDAMIWKDLGSSEKFSIPDGTWVAHVASVLINARAEPTTEFIESKRPKDIQPFIVGNTMVAHNGTVANDKELLQELGVLLPSTSIDSIALAHLFDALPANFRRDPNIIKALLSRVVGSYALAVSFFDDPGLVILACNYKPLHLRSMSDGMWFASEVDTLYSDAIDRLSAPVQTLSPYSIAILEDGCVSGSTEIERPHSEKVLAICSSGMDSTVAAVRAHQAGHAVEMLHFLYGCQAQEQELRAIARIAHKMEWPLHVQDMTPMFKSIGGSTLTSGGPIRKVNNGEAGAELAHEWVPARNLIMLSVAAGLAEAKGITKIILGNNIEEAGAYPDNEPEFIRLFNRTLDYAVGAHSRVEAVMPVGNMTKAEIVKLGTEIGAPLDLTWSCYEGGIIHCGQCGPCYMRRNAYRAVGIPDPLTYMSDSLAA